MPNSFMVRMLFLVILSIVCQSGAHMPCHEDSVLIMIGLPFSRKRPFAAVSSRNPKRSVAASTVSPFRVSLQSR